LVAAAQRDGITISPLLSSCVGRRTEHAHPQLLESSPWHLCAADSLRADLAELGAHRWPIGMSMALTGGVAPIGKQVLTALQIWRRAAS
jgi:hypothetical protein